MRRLSAKSLRACVLPVAGWVASALGHPVATYAASAVLHMVILGGLAYWLPGDSGPAFWMGSGNGGIGDQPSPIGSAGGAPLTAVFHFELPAAPPPPAQDSSTEQEAAIEPSFIAALAPEVIEFTPVAWEVPTRRDFDGPRIVVEESNVETKTPIPQTVATEIQREKDADEVESDPEERMPMSIRSRELAAAPSVGEVRVDIPIIPTLDEANGRGQDGAGTGGGQGDGNGGARGLAGGSFESLARIGPRNPAPVYPAEALAARMEGIVRIRVQVTADGAVKQARLDRSSGWQLLDDAALKAVAVWRFDPARRGGVPVDCEVVVPIDFYLRRS